MAEQTGIAWCDSTFNPWIGCTKVGPGCENCYAAAQDKFRGWTPMGWGSGNPRRRTRPALWAEVRKWHGQPYYECSACGWRGTATEHGKHGCHCGSEHLYATRRRVFCASLADVFDNEVAEEWRADLWNLMAECTNLDWLLVTKRIGNAAAMLPWDGDEAPWPHVWLLATVCNQQEAERDIPKLLATPAALRGLSMEPLLGNVTLWAHLPRHPELPRYPGLHTCEPPALDWVIVGGESGPQARDCNTQALQDVVLDCASARVPVFVKQLGDRPVIETTSFTIRPAGHPYGPKGGAMHLWPAELRVRQHPASPAQRV